MTRDPDLSALAQRGSAPAPQAQKPSGLATGLAAVMPFVVGLLATVVFVVGLADEGVMRFFEETGWPFYAIVLATWFSAVVLTVTLVLAGRGARVPAAVSLFFAGLPWVVGVAGARMSTSHAIDAIEYADPASRAMLLAAGIAEASGARLLGAWCTSALAGSLALGLAITALGQRSTNRKPLFGAVGLVLALPVLALAGYGALSREFDTHAIYGVVAALGVLTAVALAAAGAGDSPHGRAASLSAAVVPAAFVSFLGAVAAMETGGFRKVLGALGGVDPSARARMLAYCAEPFIVGGRIAGLATATLGLAALVVAGWAASRARPTLGRIVGGAAVAFVTLLIVGADLSADLATQYDVAEMTLSPWQSVAGFSPTTVGLSGEASDGPPVAIVTVDGVLPFGGEPIPRSTLATPAGRDALTAALRAARGRAQAQAQAGRSGSENVPSWLDERPEHLDRDAPPSSDAPQPDGSSAMALAIDARVPAADLRIVIDAARAAGARSLTLVGAGARVDAEAMARLQKEAPLIAAIGRPVGSVTVLLESALPAGYADTDALLWHATVTSRGEGRLTTRVGADDAPLLVPTPEERRGYRGGYRDPDAEPRAVAYLALGDDATSETLAAFALAASEQDLQPLVVTGPLPGGPERPFTPTAPDEGTIGLGGLGRGGGSGYGRGAGGFRGGSGAIPQIRTGDADIRGSLSQEVIRRVIRRHINEVRFCYERELRDHPALAGRVVAHFVISPTGAVQSATASSPDMGSPAVETCIANAVRRWTFPAPEGGGVVVVEYPFVLQSAN